MTSPYLNSFEVAEYLRKVNPDGSLNLKAARVFINRYVGKEWIRKAGHAVLVHKDGIEQALKPRNA